ncbi:uncharacterized protein LOC132738745 [Ruditapes philippinarum]|uniref:uncharacterized protein LOC132738745 n=1 Tax=Ruditapes philippinarum TaxID=129788 RepID=UPI00295B47BD|nr:uncharacterized protein LOC132738745 [Ruditapes philippinarum]
MSEERTYYIRTSVMYTDLTRELLCKVFKYLIKSDDITDFLSSPEQQNILRDLFQKNVINRYDYDLVHGQGLNLERFDISLLLRLILNLCKDNISKPQRGWQNKPHPKDESLGADLLRLIDVRNKIIGHRADAKLSKAEFEKTWAKIRGILLRVVELVDSTASENCERRINEYRRLNVDTENAAVKRLLDELLKYKKEFDYLQEKVEELSRTSKEFQVFFQKNPERFVRFIKLLFNGGRIVLCGILEKKLGDQDLSKFLEKKKGTLTRNIGEKFSSYLYPHESCSDYKNWDIFLLASVLLLTFDDDLSQKEIMCIGLIKSARVNYASLALQSLDADAFLISWTDLIICLKHLSFNIAEDDRQQVEHLIELYKKKGEAGCDVEEYFKQLRESGVEVKTLNDVYNETITELSDMLNQLSQKAIKFQQEYVLKFKLLTTCENEEIKKRAEDILEINTQIQKSDQPSGSQRKEIDKVLAFIATHPDVQLVEASIQNLDQPSRISTMKYKYELPEEIRQMDDRSIQIFTKALQEGKVPVRNIRVMVVGHYEVGKSTLTKRLLGMPVDITIRKPTEGIDVHTDRCRRLEDGTWMLPKSGKERFNVLGQLANILEENTTDDNIAQMMQTEVTESIYTRNPTVDPSHVSVQQKKNEDTEINSSVRTGKERFNVVGQLANILEENTTDDDVAQMMQTEVTESIYTRNPTDDPSHVSVQQKKVEDTKINSSVRTEMTNQDFTKKEGETTKAKEKRNDKLKMLMEEVLQNEEKGAVNVSIWDFAGQDMFYSTHQVFLCKRAVYLLITDISKYIKENVKDHWSEEESTERQVSEYIDFWLNSIHHYCGYSEKNGPPVVLVCTFADKLPKGISRGKAKVTLNGHFDDKIARCHLTEETFIIDNSVEDENIIRLREHIFDAAARQEYWKEDIPAKWVTLENVIMKLKDEKMKLIRKEKLQELNLALPTPLEDDELELYLRFHHEAGNILYFSQESLTKHVIIDPQWLIDAFKSITMAGEECSNEWTKTVAAMWKDFEKSGILKPELIDAIWTEDDNINHFKSNKALLLEYLEILGLIAKPHFEESNEIQARNLFFVPMKLTNSPPEEITSTVDTEDCKYSSKLCFTTCKKTEERFLPDVIFNKFLAACIKKWELVYKGSMPVVFYKGAIFNLKKDNHDLNIFHHDHVIQIWVTRYSSDGKLPCSALCIELKQKVIEMLESVIRNKCNIEMFVKCCQSNVFSNQCMFPLVENQDWENRCDCRGKRHCVTYRDLMQCWLQGKVNVFILSN